MGVGRRKWLWSGEPVGFQEKGKGGGHARGIRRLEERCGLERRLVVSNTKMNVVGDTDGDEATQWAQAEEDG